MRLATVACLLNAFLLAPMARADDRAFTVIPMFAQSFVLVQPAGWSLAFQYRDENSASVQFLPDGQQFGDWREMIAVQSFRGLAKRTEYGPDVMLRIIRAGLAPHCATEIISSRLDAVTISGYPAHAMLMGCPEALDDFGDFLPGQGEMAVYLSIKGRQDFYVLRHAVRSARFSPHNPPLRPDNIAAMADKIAPLLLCENGEALQACLVRNP